MNTETPSKSHPTMNGGGTPKKRILFIGGSLNQTTMMHKIAVHLIDQCEVKFSPFFADGFIGFCKRNGFFRWILDKTVMGGEFFRQTMEYFMQHELPLDVECRNGPYDLVVIGSDIMIPQRIRKYPMFLIQEGMTNPENLMVHVARFFNLPGWMGIGTCMNGESLAYEKFCVASDGYLEFFHKKGKGIPREKLVVTGIPNFDHCERYRDNHFPHHGHVLVCTSDLRETQIPDDRIGFLRRCRESAHGREVIFKLHPNENYDRAIREIHSVFPGALVYTEGCAEEMVANAEEVICQWSSLAFVGLALGKKVQSYFDVEELKRLLPQQNGGRSGSNIAHEIRKFLHLETPRQNVRGIDARFVADDEFIAATDPGARE